MSYFSTSKFENSSTLILGTTTKQGLHFLQRPVSLIQASPMIASKAMLYLDKLRFTGWLFPIGEVPRPDCVLRKQKRQTLLILMDKDYATVDLRIDWFVQHIESSFDTSHAPQVRPPEFRDIR